MLLISIQTQFIVDFQANFWQLLIFAACLIGYCLDDSATLLVMISNKFYQSVKCRLYYISAIL